MVGRWGPLPEGPVGLSGPRGVQEGETVICPPIDGCLLVQGRALIP